MIDMSKVLGGGSSINVKVWARGHKNDWERAPHMEGVGENRGGGD
jgi:choline dehydrogenase